jgi:hypothetical protein
MNADDSDKTLPLNADDTDKSDFTADDVEGRTCCDGGRVREG